MKANLDILERLFKNKSIISQEARPIDPIC